MSNLDHGKVILKFNNSVLVLKIFSSLYSTFILNLYIVYEINTWPRNPTNKTKVDEIENKTTDHNHRSKYLATQ